MSNNSDNYRNELIFKLFNDDINYIKEKNLDKIKDSFSNKNIDDIIYGINLFYSNDFKEKKLFDLYKLMVFDFCNNNEKINCDNNIIINILVKKISILDKGYQLLHIIHNKYNLNNYASSILEYVLKRGTLTNLLFVGGDAGKVNTAFLPLSIPNANEQSSPPSLFK